MRPQRTSSLSSSGGPRTPSAAAATPTPTTTTATSSFSLQPSFGEADSSGTRSASGSITSADVSFEQFVQRDREAAAAAAAAAAADAIAADFDASALSPPSARARASASGGSGSTRTSASAAPAPATAMSGSPTSTLTATEASSSPRAADATTTTTPTAHDALASPSLSPSSSSEDADQLSSLPLTHHSSASSSTVASAGASPNPQPRNIRQEHHMIAKSKFLREHAKALHSTPLEWIAPPTTVFVIKKFRDRAVTERLKEITTWLVAEKQLTVFVESSVLQEDALVNDVTYAHSILPKLQNLDVSTIGTLADQIDFIICLGGDGTILYASSLFQGRCPPVMSFHMGSLGFLMPFDVRNFKERIECVLLGKCLVTMRMRLECEVIRSKNNQRASMLPHVFHALNEIVIDRGPSPFLGDLQVFCDGKHITSVQGDGLIVATPTGSTAYSVSAGGSMVHPNVPAMLLTPICPHTLSFRPILVPDTVELRLLVSLTSRNSAWISLDGRNPQELKQGDGLRIVSSPWPVPTINRVDQSTDWFRSLSQCLNWNVRQKQLPFNEESRYRPSGLRPYPYPGYESAPSLDDEEDNPEKRRISAFL
ncbi:poly(p)/ATP nad kinase [Capsaspora owczarzaki ATCC 30864]|nr:poly(p)/ATP nad kinase [Capsaspora owczarzaki ATCC 30864]|eukprot:XP_004347505.2 poly(p)/ATP nad kinase [Capsaspora owczarzaki ATCC 30864]